MLYGTYRSHYTDVIMGTIASQITSLTIVYSTVYSDADESKHQSYASLAFVPGIRRRPVNSPHKWPVTRKMRPFDDVIMLHAHIGMGKHILFTGNIKYIRQGQENFWIIFQQEAHPCCKAFRRDSILFQYKYVYNHFLHDQPLK